MDYAKTLKSFRDELLISQAELSIMLGVSFATVNRWENGLHQPSLRQKRKIRSLLEKHRKDKIHDYQARPNL